LSLTDPGGATSGNKQYLAGLPESLSAGWERSIAENPLPIYPAAIERMVWHWSQNHRVFLVSGTIDFLARQVALRLPGPVEVRATRLQAHNGCWTGRLAGEHMSSQAKGRAVRELAARFGLSLWESYAYGNSASDLPMLDAVGHRMAVNPHSRLNRIARDEGWPICNWRHSLARREEAMPRLSAKEAG
jgi:HAD superfamily hydrolase (TIGR01490 family)